MSNTSARVRSPLTIDLEARLATAKAKTKRSIPQGRANTGAPTQVGDENAVREYPGDGEKTS
jgi:hypothetical protein